MGQGLMPNAQMSKLAILSYISCYIYIYKRVCDQIIMSNSPAKEPQPSYVKLAMRNMVRKGGTSLKHFALTTIGLLAVFVGLAYLTH
jgi:hypothetical protein